MCVKSDSNSSIIILFDQFGYHGVTANTRRVYSYAILRAIHGHSKFVIIMYCPLSYYGIFRTVVYWV